MLWILKSIYIFTKQQKKQLVKKIYANTDIPNTSFIPLILLIFFTLATNYERDLLSPFEIKKSVRLSFQPREIKAAVAAAAEDVASKATESTSSEAL